MLRNLLYRFADVIAVQADEAPSWAREVAYGRPIATLPNPAPAPRGDCVGAAEIALPPGPKVAGMGRLVYEKGFGLLSESLSRISDRHPEWKIVFFREGPEWYRLERLIDDRDLSGRVFPTRQVSNADAVLNLCDLFVVSSRHEGFPNVLCEAMACGLEVVSFD